MNMNIKVWEEDVVIPTYPTGKPEKNPMFLEKRVYQGSSGVVYPHAVIEKIHDHKTDKTYKGLFLENEYLKVMILPELGGRIQMAYDKVKQRHFIYYNQVIKPALVGLTGPWISGGIEFNWPQHHRPSTFDPVDHTITENADGSKTVWVNEVERMSGTKGMAGFTLYPGKAYIEITGRLYNRTPFPQTFLWWANPAVKVNDHYQSVFPPDVYAVYDHGKRDVSAFPIAKGVYYKVNYAPGADISRYKNIPVPTSYMAISSKYNFIGGYEHDTGGGLLHIADHHISPGKKQWTWGHGEFGQAWDRNLTDEDGPYIELMTGVYTDNQPDFSWLQPYEEKTFVQYFMPYSEAGLVKNATKEAVINLEQVQEETIIKLYVTAVYENLRVLLQDNTGELFSECISCAPGSPYIKHIPLNRNITPGQLLVTVTDPANGKMLVSYRQEAPAPQEIPIPAVAAKLPADIDSTEQLYLTGIHLEQFRHATFVAADYYEEALRRDPGDVRNNNALGLWFLRRGKFAKAESYFRQGIHTVTRMNANPYDGELYYNLGWALKMQGKRDEAFNAFYKSTWNDAWQHAGYLNLARMATGKGDYEEALSFIDRSVIKNYHSHSARHVKAILLRRLNRNKEATAFIEESLLIDPFNFGCLYEKFLLLSAAGEEAQATTVFTQLKNISRNWVHNFIEYALDYAHAGLYTEATTFLLAHGDDKSDRYPMIYYYLGWFAVQQGQQKTAMNYYAMAASLNPDYCFPNRIEDVPVLQQAIEMNPADANAWYFLGNFWYDKKQYADAIWCWGRSIQVNSSFPTAHRNLALAYYNKRKDYANALASLEKAFALDNTDARVLMELDQLYKRLNRSPQQRLALLEKHPALIESRDDLYLERIILCNQLAQYEKAKELIAGYRFHPWEGGEGKVVGQYLVCHLELAKQAIEQGNSTHALELLDQAENYPSNLGEGKLYGAQENDIHYLQGLAYEQLSKQEADKYFNRATKGISEPVQAIFYNDPQPDKIFYQGLAWMKLGDRNKASAIFQKLIDFGRKHMGDKITIDYFAVSLPDLLVFDADLDLRNKIHCMYMTGLGYLGLGNGNTETAVEMFNKVLELDINHQGAAIHREMVKYMSFAW